MGEPKTECTQCGATILGSTANDNHGRCRSCGKPPNLERVSEGLQLGIRLLIGLFVGALLGSLGFAIGSRFGIIVGTIVAIPFTFIGFIYGLFFAEANTAIRAFFSIYNPF